jgi:DNA-binding MarR family transcriptional regulator
MSQNAPKRYDRIVELISLWEQFEDPDHDHDILDFAWWVLAREFPPQRPPQKIEPKRLYDESVEGWGAKIPALDDLLTFLFGRLGQFLRHYVRDAFHGLDISSLDDFSILAGIGLLGRPTKTEVYQMALASVTTGSETLRRFLSLGLIEEAVDERDRRARRVFLTEKGKAASEEATRRLSKVAKVGVSALSDAEKEALLGLLSKLHDFHEAKFKVGEPLSATPTEKPAKKRKK